MMPIRVNRHFVFLKIRTIIKTPIIEGRFYLDCEFFESATVSGRQLVLQDSWFLLKAQVVPASEQGDD